MRQRDTFRIVKFDEGGVKGGPPDKQWRLVCVLDGGGKLAIWGEDGVMGNINKVEKAGLPCTVKCEYQDPKDYAREQFGHTCWVQQDFDLEIVA